MKDTLNTSVYDCVVVGPIHYNTLNVMRDLGQSKIKSLLILVGEHQRNFVTVSRYVTDVIHVNDYENIIGKLLEICKHSEHKIPLIAINDRSAAVIDRKYNLLSDNYILPNCNHTPGEIVKEMHKTRQVEVAKNCGFNTPLTILTKTNNFKPQLQQLSFPCIIKPAKSIDGSKSDVKVCYSINEVEKHLYSLGDNKEVLIQEYINNRNIFLLAGVRCEDGTIIIPGIIEKIKKGTQNKTLGLNAFVKLTKYNGRLLKLSIKYLEEINYHGLFSFEFANNQIGAVNIEDSYFIELNLRADGSLCFYQAGGVSLPTIWANTSSTKNEVRVELNKDIFGINESVYITEYLFKSNIINTLWDFIRTRSYSHFSFKDPHPFFKKFFKI